MTIFGLTLNSSEIIRTVLVATVIALLQNWLYDILKQKNFFPDNPKINYFLLLVTVSLVFVVSFSESSTPQESNIQESNFQQSAEMVSACQKAHGMQSPKVTQGKELDENRAFFECNWLPKTYSDPDGYSEIRINLVDAGTSIEPIPLPGEGFAPNFDIAAAARIFSSCSKLRIESSINIQGAGESGIVTVINAKTIHDIRDTPTENDKLITAVVDFIGEYGILVIKPERNETIVLLRNSYYLDYVECVE